MNPAVLAIRLAADAFYVALLVRVIFSWMRPRRLNLILRWLDRVSFAATEPVLRPIRRVLFRYQAGSPVDFSPVVAYLLVELISRLLARALYAL